MPMHRRSRRGFTLIETAAVAMVAVAGLAVSQPASSRARDTARQLKDSAQIRNIGQALVVFAQQNRDEYVRPSKMDRNDATVKAPAATKDTTGAIFSIMVWNGMLSPEICVSPAENNPNIKVDSDYESFNPRAAANRPEAVWDPAFSADFTDGRTGNVSYAHQMLFGSRLSRWSSTFNSMEAVVCNRGPEVKSVEYQPGDLVMPTLGNPDSNTFKFFKDKGAWSGNVLFNDAHVEFVSKYITPGQTIDTPVRYLNDADQKKPDVPFYDEPDDAKSANNFLSIFIKAGAERADFKAIWD